MCYNSNMSGISMNISYLDGPIATVVLVNDEVVGTISKMGDGSHNLKIKNQTFIPVKGSIADNLRVEAPCKNFPTLETAKTAAEQILKELRRYG